jgi:N-acetylglucosamine kinase-like BadF-type ATPase
MEQPILLLGLDGGGSKTHVVVAGADGRILGRGSAGASNYQYVGEARAIAEISRAIEQAYAAAGEPLRPADAACFGFGGADTPEEMAAMQSWIRRHEWARRYLLLNDGLLPLYAACPDGHGAAVVAGTGAIMWAQTRDGRIARASGWGYLFGDEGSGYSLGSETLRHIMRGADGRGPRTALAERVLAHWQLPDTRHLLLHLYGREVLPAEIAGLARVALECAADGDAVALGIARAGADELAQAVEAAMRGVGLRPPATLAYTGSLLVKSALYRALFGEAIRARVGPVDLRGVELPVLGALAAAVLFRSGELAARNEWHIVGTS